MSNEFLIKTMYLYPERNSRGTITKNDKLLVISKDLDNNEYKIREIDSPSFTFYESKPDCKDEHFVLYKNEADCIPINCKYHDLEEVIIDKTNRKDFFNLLKQNKRSLLNRKVHQQKNIHGSDYNVEDYYLELFYNKHPLNLVKNEIKMGYYDIEVDGLESDGFPEEQKANFPVNVITFILDKTFYFYALDYTKSKYFLKFPKLEFFRKLKENKKYQKELETELFDFLKKKQEKISKKKDIKETLITEFKFVLFDKEEDMIRSFFKKVNEIKPYIMAAWNATFDFLTLLNRISRLNDVDLEENSSGYSRDNRKLFRFSKVAREAIVPEEFLKLGIDYVQYTYDTSSHKIEERTHVSKIASFTHWVDQEQLYAFRRKTQKQDSWSLDRTGEIVLEERKYKLPRESTMKDFVYTNPKKFFKYALTDTFLQLFIEEVTKDMYMFWNLTQQSCTRFDRATKKSTILCNLLRNYMKKNKKIMSNNHSFLFSDENFVGKKVKGAFCGDPNLIENVGEKIFEDLKLRSNKIFHNVVDEDLASIYPNTEIAFNIFSDTMVGKIRFTDKPETYKIDDEAKDFVNCLISDDNIELGNKYFNLPNENQLIKNFKK